ncbi:fungal-specific transcription factor domain-containing protein [Elsinoe ampelina]|uniref:Fungal-specific transcription factor domain-containing protein n=1 Tax=Elsinoe ampelina TaxID=302913 RepID=A0A6A6GJH3_9PEZI|nr:fungal-specific transcription factor domain-containing protein [Elsinoe ampelina]
MPAATLSAMPSDSNSPASAKKPTNAPAPEKKYKCQFCNRAFSRSEHRSRHERSHTKERPFKCFKCRSTFVRRDLLLRHDRTVHAKDGGAPLQSDSKRRSSAKAGSTTSETPKPSSGLEQSFDQMDNGNDGMFGVEEAAMLMTNFQQKAAMSTQAQSESILADAPRMMESNSVYSPAAMTLPNMHWDPMLPQPHPQQHSSPSGPVDMFANHDGMHGPMNHDLSMPGFPSSSFLAGITTPGALSPFPSMMGPVSPVDYRRSPGPPQACKESKSPQIESEEQMFRIMENIKKCDSEGSLFETFSLPDVSVLNRYLHSYFSLFHHHLPFLHPASFDPSKVSAALLLSVLSIGALYTFEQDHAYMLHIGSKLLVNQFLMNKENFSSRKSPLWAMQSTLLNMIFASWSGDPKGLEWACSVKSLVANMVAGNGYELKLRSEARKGAQPSHSEWIEDEGCRRTYYAVYIFFGLLTLTYNHTPAISFNEFEPLDLPSSESLWGMEDGDDEAWREMLQSSSIITFKQAHHALFAGDVARYSAFATRVMINALFLETWYHKRSPEALQDVVTEYKLRLALETWEKSLDLCEPETIVVQLSAPLKGHPLIFNAKAMYHNTVARLLVDLKGVQEALRYHDSYEVAGAMTVARDKIKRSGEMLKVIQACYDFIEFAAKQGVRWVARTSATNWSIEHPLCGMDLLIILSHWLWRLEHDEEPATPEESQMYEKLRELLKDQLVGAFDTKLSSAVARTWGAMIDEVVVWGITKLMGESFKLHAQALSGYEDAMLAGAQEQQAPMAAHHNLAVAAY